MEQADSPMHKNITKVCDSKIHIPQYAIHTVIFQNIFRLQFEVGSWLTRDSGLHCRILTNLYKVFNSSTLVYIVSILTIYDTLLYSSKVSLNIEFMHEMLPTCFGCLLSLVIYLTKSSLVLYGILDCVNTRKVISGAS